MSDANSLKSYLVDHNWDHIKVLYGPLGPSESRARSILNSLIEQVDYFPHKVRLCRLDAALNPVFSEGQPPPYATIEQLRTALAGQQAVNAELRTALAAQQATNADQQARLARLEKLVPPGRK